MKVVFNNFAEFLDELRKVETEYVRVTAKEQAVNDGVSELFLRAGFLVGEDLNELTQCCGETWKGNSEAEMKYEACEIVINDVCKEKGIEVRGGEYDG